MAWALKFPDCGLTNTEQSPINIDLKTAVKSEAASKLTFTNWKVRPESIRLMNREESVEIIYVFIYIQLILKFPRSDISPITITAPIFPLFLGVV